MLTNISYSGGLFGIIIDETTDISNVKQTSYCLRYVEADFVAIEIFMGFVETDAFDGYSLYTQIKHTLTALGIDLINCRARGYDGASNMRGKLHGVKTRMLNEYPKALY